VSTPETSPGTPDAPLSGVRVLDIGQHIAGPYCARLLGDQGADVIKVEPPSGDSARALPPFAGDDAHPEKSLHFLYLNYNKRGVTADLTTPRGRDILLSLVKGADVLVENFEPGYLSSLGLGYEALKRINPRLIVTSITHFGQTGPRRDWRANDLITYAASGIMYISGTVGREPLKHGTTQSDFAGGLAATIPTLAALYMREFTGEGQHVDVSIAEVLTSTLVTTVPYYTYMGETLRRRDREGAMLSSPAPARDGWVIPHANRRREWGEFCGIIQEPRLLDPKYSTAKGRIVYADEIDQLIGDALKKLDRFDLFHNANRKRLQWGVVQTPEDLAHCEHLVARGFFHEVDHPVAGRLRYPGSAFATTEGGFQLRRRAPLLGEHNDDILAAKAEVA
jgi:crotonobetainyl-CoA:carnitine CoA-transferase CaiB-like acyl-CoA transferase